MAKAGYWRNEYFAPIFKKVGLITDYLDMAISKSIKKKIEYSEIELNKLDYSDGKNIKLKK